jgi:hypothetical protein
LITCAQEWQFVRINSDDSMLFIKDASSFRDLKKVTAKEVKEADK